MAYIGSAEDARRIRKQEEEREKQRKEFEERKKLGESNVDGAGLRQFGAGRAEVLEAAFKNETVGLVTREEFVSKKNTLKDRLQEEAEREKRRKEEEAAARRAERQKKKQRTDAKSKLSFAEDEPEEGEDDGNAEAEVKEDGDGHVPVLRLGKNPNAETSFLPDRDRQKQEEEVRQQVEREYEIREEELKSEPLEITYSYFDGSGHRRVITVTRGDSVGDFLKQVREQLAPDFKELRNISLNNLLFIKEDVILPHSVTFHRLISRKVRSRTGPLFDFGVHEDVRACSDSRIKEKTDAHAGKVVTRNFYDRNKHIIPASKWESLSSDA